MRFVVFLSVAMFVVAPGCTEPNPSLAGGSGDGGGTTSATGTDASTTASTSTTTATSGATSSSGTTTGSDTGSMTGSDTGTTTGTFSCPTDTHTCATGVPAGWSGPVAIIEGAHSDPEPSCEGDYTELALTMNADVSAAEASCDCDCEAPQEATCSTAELRYYGSSNNCSNSINTSMVSSECNTGPSGGASTYWRVAPPSVTNGTCEPTETVQVPEASFLTRITACAGGSDAGGCPDPNAGCLPLPTGAFDGRLCIYGEGDLMCPPNSEYTDRVVYFGSIADDRGCEPCTCDTATGTCQGSVYLHDAENCGIGTIVGEIPATNGCTQGEVGGVSNPTVAGRWNQTDVTASCPPSEGTPTGTATGADPVTLCCREG